MARVIKVSQLNKHLYSLLTNDFTLKELSVEGEVSNYKGPSRNGHIYFTLKDTEASILCVMWASDTGGFPADLKNGDKIVVHGRIGFYPARGDVQLQAKRIEHAGRGEILADLERRKDELRDRGFFADEHKKPIPKYPQSVGVVTSISGEAINDILRNLKKYCKWLRVVVYPAAVQGEGSKESIVRGIEILDKMALDVIIVGRGGGADEDLWSFNEVCVAEAIYNASTPIVSAVGHEGNFTIADYVADKRASVPGTAAKEVMEAYENLSKEIDSSRRTISRLMRDKIKLAESRLHTLGIKIEYMSPRGKLDRYIMERDRLAEGILRNHPTKVLNRRIRELQHAAERLESMSPVKRLAAGYSYITDEDGRNITTSRTVSVGDKINITLSEGSIRADVTEVTLPDHNS